MIVRLLINLVKLIEATADCFNSMLSACHLFVLGCDLIFVLVFTYL